MQQIPLSIAKGLSDLNELIENQKKLAFKFMSDYGGAFGLSDQLILGALNRSFSLMCGFSEMIRQGNYMCAIPLIRFQMDSVMRVSALWLVEKPDEVAKRILSGENLKDIKTRDGKLLKDFYLHSELSKKYPRFSEVYKETSDFVHLSKKHIISMFEWAKEKDGKRQLGVKIGPPDLVDWAEADVLKVIETFVSVTKLLHGYVEDWSGTREVFLKVPKKYNEEELSSKS